MLIDAYMYACHLHLPLRGTWGGYYAYTYVDSIITT